MKIKIINKSNNQLPHYETKSSAGMDIKAYTPNDITLEPLERTIVKTGLFLSLPVGYEAQVRSRSGLSIKNGVCVLNSPGTIDSDYRGEVGVILINLSKEPFLIQNGDRIAQLVIAHHEQGEWIEVEELSNTERGNKGFGSTGTRGKHMNFVKYFFLILIVASCKPYNSSDFKVEFEKLNSKQLVRKVIRAKSNFKTYQAKAKLRLNNNGKNKSYGLNVRIQKNEAIWLSSTAGIVRALLTKDSIYYYNKLEKNYLVSDYKNIENIIGLRLTYNMLQNLLLSEPIIDIKNSSFNNKMSAQNLSYIFNWSLTNDEYKKLNIENFEGIYKVNVNNFKLDLCSFKVSEIDNSFSLYEIRYLDFIKLKNQIFTSKIKIDINSINQINIDLKSINLNKKFKLPFKIPKNYKKILIDNEIEFEEGRHSLDKVLKASEIIKTKKVMDFIVLISNEINNIQIAVMEFSDLYKIINNKEEIYYKEHPFSNHFMGIKEQRDWMFPEIESKSSQLLKTQKLLKSQYAEMILRSYKTRSKTGKLMFVFSSANFQQALKRIQYFKQYSEYQPITLKKIKKNSAELKTLNNQLQEERNSQEVLISNNQKIKTNINTQILDKNSLLQSISSNQKKYVREITSNQKKTAEIDKQIQRIIALAIAESNKKKNTSSKVFELTPEAKILSKNFMSNKGKLPWPVEQGYVTLRYGKQPHPVVKTATIQSNGIRIITSSSQKVRSIFTGVVYRIISSKNGAKTILIQHGNYITSYNNLDKGN